MSSHDAVTLITSAGAARDDSASARQPFLSTLPAGPREQRLALAVVLLSSAIFFAVAPFAKTPLAAVPAFLPVYQSALVVNDLITAALLFGQFANLRARALLVLASAYLFSALMAVSHALSFPGLFAPSGLLGAGGQTTAWLYFLWHGIFPLLVIGYSLLAGDARETDRARGSALAPILSAMGAVFLLVCGLTLVTTAGHDALPAIMQGDLDAPAKVIVATVSWALCLIALPFLWRRRPHSVLDLWLMVVMCVWIFDIALASVLNHGRYDLGWYAGRVYGLLAASFVLLVLLLENGRIYAELVGSRESERRRARDALARHAERLRILHEIDRAIAAEESPQAIAGAVIQPVRELLGVPRAIVNMFDFAAGEVEWLAAAGRHRVRIGGGRYPMYFMGNVELLRRGEPQRVDVDKLPPGPEVDALLASGVHVFMAVPMIAGGDLIGALSFGGAEDNFPSEQVAIAQEVATQLAIAIIQARLFERVKRHADELEQRVRERTAQLEAANRELEAFSYSVSHDLRAPLRAIDGFSRIVQEDYAGKLDDEGGRLLGVIRDNSQKMAQLIDDLLEYSRLGRKPLSTDSIDMKRLVEEVFGELQASGGKPHRLVLAALPRARGDATLVKQAWTNLLANAIKFSGKRREPVIEVSGHENGVECVYCVKDNGAGFDMRYHEKLFKVFQRLHREEEFDGTGVGLAIVQRVVLRHGGRVWAEGKVDEGAAFYFSLPKGRQEGPMNELGQNLKQMVAQ